MKVRNYDENAKPLKQIQVLEEVYVPACLYYKLKLSWTDLFFLLGGVIISY